MIASMNLQYDIGQLLAGFGADNLPQGLVIQGIASDSRRVRPGFAFFACQGGLQERPQYIISAVENGAAVVVVDADEPLDIVVKVPLVRIRGLAEKLGHIAAKYFDYPARQLVLIGVTGTNGKTSCSHLMAQSLASQGIQCGIIGTLGYGLPGDLTSLENTTPGAIDLQGILYQLQSRATHVVMEVSSHGIAQHRIAGCEFRFAVFTNLSRDHLDFHGSMQEYGATKLKLFQQKSLATAVVNLDDAFAKDIKDGLSESVALVGASLHCEGDRPGNYLCGDIVERSLEGTRVSLMTSWGNTEFTTHLLGEFNITNILLVLGVALELGLPLIDCIRSVEELRPPAGRLESFSAANKPLVIVDYAHTPDALEKVLQTLRFHTEGDLWVLFGCGGDRDKGKRPQMGRIAERYADHVWLTNDNPRGESPQRIIDDILQGIQNSSAIRVVPARDEAIRAMIHAAAANDIVLIAGKGHEDYQLIGNRAFPFSDRETVSRISKVAA